MYLLEELPEPAIELIFEHADIDTCVALHKIFKFDENIWRKQIHKLYCMSPEEAIFNDFKFKEEKIENQILGCIYAGCDPNARGNQYEYDICIRSEHLLNYLIKHLGIRGVSKEIYQDYMNMLEYVIMNVKDINAKGNNARTAFEIACDFVKLEVCKLLVKREDIDIDMRDNDGNTPLVYACASSNYEMIEFLIKNGANVEKDMDGYKSPLAYSIEWGYEELTKFLKEQISANK